MIQRVSDVGAARGPDPADEIVVTRTTSVAGKRHLREFWRYRELLFFLTWRDVKVRYKQTVLGAAWAILVPVTSAALFTVVFNRVARIDAPGVPYPLFAYSALLPWTFLATALQLSTQSVVGSQQLMTKVYFPRIFVAVAPALAGLLDIAIAASVLVVLIVYYGVVPSIAGLVLAPAFIMLALMTTIGVGAWLAALNVKYRDVRFVAPFFIQLWFFATPVVYPISALSDRWQALYGLNPMTGVVEGFRWAFTGGPSPDVVTTGISALVAVLCFVGGTYYFLKTERTFADVI